MKYKNCLTCGQVSGGGAKKCKHCGGGFFGNLWNGIKKVGSVLGPIAKVAGPILRAIPHPYTQTAGRALALTGNGRKKRGGAGKGGGAKKGGVISAPKGQQDVKQWENYGFTGMAGAGHRKKVHK